MNYVMTYENLNLEANRLICALLTRAYSVETGTILCKSPQMQFFLLNYMKLAFAHVHYFLGSRPLVWPPKAQCKSKCECEGQVSGIGRVSIFNARN